MQLQENYLGTGTDATLTSVTDSLDIKTHNYLYGMQIGADIPVFDLGGPVKINVLCKAGAYDNYAHEDYVRSGASSNRGDHGRNQASFLGETGVSLDCSLTKRLAFHACAKGMWITGLAVAPEQIAAVNLATNRYSINHVGCDILLRPRNGPRLQVLTVLGVRGGAETRGPHIKSVCCHASRTMNAWEHQTPESPRLPICVDGCFAGADSRVPVRRFERSGHWPLRQLDIFLAVFKAARSNRSGRFVDEN